MKWRISRSRTGLCIYIYNLWQLSCLCQNYINFLQKRVVVKNRVSCPCLDCKLALALFQGWFVTTPSIPKENRMVNLRDMPKKPKTASRLQRGMHVTTQVARSFPSSELYLIVQAVSDLFGRCMTCPILTQRQCSLCLPMRKPHIQGGGWIEVVDKGNVHIYDHLWSGTFHQCRCIGCECAHPSGHSPMVCAFKVYALFREDIKEEVPSGKGEGSLCLGRACVFVHSCLWMLQA